MFDPNVYNTIFQAAYTILGNNAASLGKAFCEGFMFDYDPRNGPNSQRNAQTLFDYVTREAMRMNNGAAQLDDNQLFHVVGVYVKGIADQFQRQQVGGNRGGFGFNSGPSMFGNGPAGGGMFSQGNNGSMFGQQAQTRPTPGSYLADDTIQTPSQPMRPTPVPSPVSTSPLSFAPPKAAENPVASVKYVPNPLDDIPDSGIEFRKVENRPIWGEEKAKDRRIVIGQREDQKTNDQRFMVNRTGAFHQLILNDPMDVVKDFFEIVPDALLSTSFVFRIGYNHLSVIDVPTADFIQIREKCIAAISNEPDAVLHKKIMEVLNTMQRGPWKAMTTYLVSHINRALYLAARMSTKPEITIDIDEFEDLDLLLSSSFKHSFTNLPEGRHQLEQIVGSAIWNALAMNSDVMFTGKDIPTNAIQSSPAFPFSLEGVYPNKYSIPTSNEDTAETFLNNMKTYELSRRTYILSKRVVTITNILGQKVLPHIGKKPSVINNPAAALLASETIPYTTVTLSKNNVFSDVIPYVSERYPSEQLEAYNENPPKNEIDEVESFSRKKPHLFPVDQTIFAIQFGVNPKTYLTALDVFSMLDNQLGQGQVVMATKNVPALKVNA